MAENSSVYTVLGIDVISYSLKDLPDQAQSQEVLDRCLKKAMDEHWKGDTKDVHWIDAGDGGFLLLLGQEHVTLDIVHAVNTYISEDTRNWQDDASVDVRYAIHADRIKVWEASYGKKFTGHAINNCARLLSGMNKEQKGQVVCSGGFFDSLSSFGDATVDADRLYDVVDKHGITHRVYNIRRSPGFGVVALEREIHPDPTER
jgi:hypothetical protein